MQAIGALIPNALILLLNGYMMLFIRSCILESTWSIAFVAWLMIAALARWFFRNRADRLLLNMSHVDHA